MLDFRRPRRDRSEAMRRGLPWLLSSALVIPVLPALAEPPLVMTARTLTDGVDNVTVLTTSLAYKPAANALGLLPEVIATGIDARAGSDSVTLTGPTSISGAIAPFRNYLTLPSSGPSRALLLAAPVHAVAARGLEGGSGNDRLVNGGRLEVMADGHFTQTDFDIGDPGLPSGLGGVSLDSRLTVAAVALLDSAGFNTLINSGASTVSATAETSRGDVTMNLATLGDVPQNITTVATASGLLSTGGGDTLTNASGASLAVSASAEATSARVAVSGAELAGAGSATLSDARADGLRGGAGNDTLTNAGALAVSATATVTDIDISISAQQFGLPEIVLPDVEEESNASARAYGLVGGGGRDTLVNSGALTLSAEVNHLTIGFELTEGSINASAVETLISPPADPAEPSGGALARIAALVGDGEAIGEGTDRIENKGTILGNAHAKVQTASVAIAAPISALTGSDQTTAGTILSSISIGLSDGASASALAFADGLLGQGGGDRLQNNGVIALGSLAEADTGQISVDVLGFLSDVGGGGGGSQASEDAFNLALNVYNSGTFAVAKARGIDGGSGSDYLENLATGVVSVDANARAHNLDIDAAITVSTDDRNLNLAGSAVFGRIWAGADAVAMDGGLASDNIVSAGTLAAAAEATTQALGVEVGVDVVKSGLSLQGRFADLNIIGESTATGLKAADHGDRVEAAKTTATARSDVESLGIDATVTVATKNGLVGSGAFITAEQNSLATARAIDRLGLDPLPGTSIGGSLPGLTRTAADAALTATAEADFSRVGIAATVDVANNGVAIGATALKLGNLTSADAIGFQGSQHFDDLVIGGPIVASAISDAQSSTTAATVNITDSGVAAGVGLVITDTAANAAARGVALGGGDDLADLAQAIDAKADSANFSNSNAVSVSGTNNGVALGASLVSSSTSSDAYAAAIDAGAGRDSVRARSRIAASATAETDVVAVSVTAAGSVNGVGLGAALGETTGSATGRATAAALGGDDDRFDADGAISANASADSSNTGVSAAISGAYNGVSAGVAGFDIGTSAYALATGVDGGSGNDAINVTGALTSISSARSSTTGVTVGLDITAFGVGAGGSLLMGNLSATSIALGINGDVGADALTLGGPGTISASAFASRLDVAVSGSFAIGVAVAANYLDTTTTALARAVGLSGEGLAAGGSSLTGPGNTLLSRDALTVAANAAATGATYSFAIPVGLLPVGANVTTAAVTATARAAGQEGGTATDRITALGPVLVGAVASARTNAVSFATTGINLGDMSTTADAGALGLSGDAGDDEITTIGTVAASSTASTSNSSVGIVLTGGSVTAIGTSALADATGLAGGAGSDVIDARGTVSASAAATTPIKSIQIGLTGGALSSLASTGAATAIGVDLGIGNDRLTATRAIIGNATAILTAEAVGFTVAGVAGNDTASTAGARSIGVAGGDGNDRAEVDALTQTASASAQGNGISVALVGLGNSAVGLAASSDAAGFDGGAGDDSVVARAGAVITSVAATSAKNIGVNLTGVALDAAQVAANADAAIAHGGSGYDRLELLAGGNVVATASATTDGTSFTSLGGNSGKSGADAHSLAQGLTGDDGDDGLIATGNLAVESAATATGTSLIITIAGGSVQQNGATAEASAAGFDGGEGSDTLLNRATIDVGAGAIAGLDSLQINGVAGTTANGLLGATAGARGLVGGSGADFITNIGALAVHARAAGNGRASSYSLIKAGQAGLSTRFAADAAGIDGGLGDDGIDNGAAITVRTAASAAGSSTSLALFAVTNQPSTTETMASAAGIRGGGGNDIINSRAPIDVAAEALGVTTSLSATGIGMVSSDAEARTLAEAAGIDGGDGDDSLNNDGSIAVAASASASAGNVSLGLLGGASTKVALRGLATAAGLAGGAGSDTIVNTGQIGTHATATLASFNRSLQIAGGAIASAGLFATADSTGISGGDGDDLLVHDARGAIDAQAAATSTLSGSDVSILGGGLRSGLGRAAATATGISGGDGSDSIQAAGSIAAAGSATIFVTSSGVTVLGVDGDASDVRAGATAIGIDGGTGDDAIFASGGLAVTAAATGLYGGTQLAVFGLAAGQAAIGASATATGIAGGPGGNLLLSNGSAPVTIAATSNAALSGSMSVGLGASIGASVVNSLARANGMVGGERSDEIRTTAPMTVTARADLGFGSTLSTFAGSATGQAAGLARADAQGIVAGTGDNLVDVAGALTIRADARAAGEGAARAGIGQAGTAAVIAAEVAAGGISALTGEDRVRIAAPVTLDMSSTVQATANVTNAVLFASGEAAAIARSLFDGAGLRDTGGNGAIEISQTGRIDVAVRSGELASGAAATRATAISNGIAQGINVEARAVANAAAATALGGVLLGPGTTSVLNNGVVRVVSDQLTVGIARAAGNATVSGEATATAIAIAQASALQGIASFGTIDLTNHNVIDVLLRPTVIADARAGANGIGILDPDAAAGATARADNLTAFGVRAAGGSIINTGSISVIAAPTANAIANATRDGSTGTSIDSFATATATVLGTVATGISMTGASNSQIVNSGTIIARANPSATATTSARGWGVDGDAFASSLAQAMFARAVGIETGDGGDIITNSGTISVSAAPSASAPASVTGGGSGDASRFRVAETQPATATAISSGGGGDFITSSGRIEAAGQIAIDAGAGNDVVALSGTIIGTVQLGSGNDTLRLIGKTDMASLADAGDGNDLLVAIGDQAVRVANFERLIKQDVGDLRLLGSPWAPTISTTIERGRVIASAGLTVAGHVLTTTIYPDRTNGQLQFTGAAATIARGSVVVLAGPGGPFVNATTWDVLRADAGLNIASLSGTTLPSNTGLLDFSSSLANNTRLRVAVKVGSMAATVSGGTVRSFARALDDATPTATGDVAATIVALQQLPTIAAVKSRLEQISPSLATMSLSGSAQALDSAVRLISARQTMLTGSPARFTSGLRFVTAPSRQARLGSWAVAFNHAPDAGLAAGPGRSSGFASGADLAPSEAWRFGLAVIRQASDTQLGASQSGGVGTSTLIAGHGLYMPRDDLRLGMRVAMGMGHFTGTRQLGGAAGSTSGRLSEGSTMIAIDGDAEYHVPLLDWAKPTIVGRLGLRSVQGDASREVTSSGLGLATDGARYRRTEAALGVRFDPSTAIGGTRLTGSLAVSLVRRLDDGGAAVAARFLGMPDFRFTLDGMAGPRTRTDIDAAIGLVTRGGMTISANVRAWQPGALPVREVRTSLSLAF